MNEIYIFGIFFNIIQRNDMHKRQLVLWLLSIYNFIMNLKASCRWKLNFPLNPSSHLCFLFLKHLRWLLICTRDIFLFLFWLSPQLARIMNVSSFTIVIYNPFDFICLICTHFNALICITSLCHLSFFLLLPFFNRDKCLDLQ